MTRSAADSGPRTRKGTQTVAGFAPRLAAALLVVLCAGIAGCGRDTTAPAAPMAAGAEPQASAEPGSFSGYRVDVTLSPAAQAKLLEGAETIIVGADYFGTPVPAAVDLADEVGQLDLGRAQRELEGAGSASFDGTGFRTDRLSQIEGEPQVNINVYSGRKSSPDNLLSCEFFQDALDVAAKAPIALHCTLIDEPSDPVRADAP